MITMDCEEYFYAILSNVSSHLKTEKTHTNLRYLMGEIDESTQWMSNTRSSHLQCISSYHVLLL